MQTFYPPLRQPATDGGGGSARRDLQLSGPFAKAHAGPATLPGGATAGRSASQRPAERAPPAAAAQGAFLRRIAPAVIGDTLEYTWQDRLVSFRAGDLESLLGLVEQRCAQFNAVNLATALHRVAALGGHGSRARCRGLLSGIEELLLAQPGRFGVQSLANMCWAVARLQWRCPELLENLSRAALCQVEKFKPSELSMLLWGLASAAASPIPAQRAAAERVAEEFLRRGASAFDAQSIATVAYASATVGLSESSPLWSSISAGSERRVTEFSDRQVVNLVWAFATVTSMEGSSLFERVEEAWLGHLRDLAPIDLSLVAWAMAKQSAGGSEFFAEVAAAVTTHERSWHQSDARNIATLIYAFALTGRAAAHDRAFRILASCVGQRLSDFAVQGLTNALWGYATASYAEAPWFEAVAGEVPQRDPEEFEPLDVANCLWAFAAVLHQSQPVVAYLKHLSGAALPEFSAQNLAISLWSFAILEVRDEALFERAADRVVQMLPECKAQELNNTLWACATVSVRLPWLFIKADAHAMSVGLGSFKLHELSITLWAHGMAGVCNHPFFDAVVDEILYTRGLDTCTPREVANSAWAYSTIIGRGHTPWLTAVAGFAVRRIEDFDMQCIGNVLWSFSTVRAFSRPLFEAACEETQRRCAEAAPEAILNVAQVLGAAHAAGFRHGGLLDAATGRFLESEAGIGSREVVVLCNAALPARARLPRWPALEALLRRRILGPLLAAMRAPDLWGVFDAVVSGLELDNLGLFYTAAFLLEAGLAQDVCIVGYGREELGIPISFAPWAPGAATRCAEDRLRLVQGSRDQVGQKLSRQLDKVNKREIVAWVSFDVTLASMSTQWEERRSEPGRTCSWRQDLEEPPPPGAPAAGGPGGLLLPLLTRSRQSPVVVGEHNRSGHAERGALLDVAATWLEPGHDDMTVRGWLRLFVTHFPCISCVCVLAQFARLFPEVRLHVAFADGRAAACRDLSATGP